MNKNDFLRTFFFNFIVFGTIVWSGSWWGWHLFHKVVHASGWSQDKLIDRGIVFAAFLILAYIFQQIRLLRKSGSSWKLLKVFLSIIGIVFIAFFAYQQDLRADGEGIDVLFCFVLALSWGYLSYPATTTFDRRGFLGALSAWLGIIFTNEMIAQRFIFSDIRKGNMGDFGINMVGVLIGLLLSIRWFWKK